MSVVEYALDIIEECQDQPGGLVRLVECQVEFSSRVQFLCIFLWLTFTLILNRLSYNAEYL